MGKSEGFFFFELRKKASEGEIIGTIFESCEIIHIIIKKCIVKLVSVDKFVDKLLISGKKLKKKILKTAQIGMQ